MRLPTEEEARIMGLKSGTESSDIFAMEDPETIYPKHKDLEVAFNIANSSGITPQQAAENIRIAKNSGVTSDLMHSSEVLRQRALLDERKNSIRSVLSHIAEKRPTTRKFLREPENMLLAQNDLGSLDKAEGLLEIPVRSLKANHLETRINALYGQAVLNGMDDGLQRQIDALTEERAALGEVPQGIVRNYLWQSMSMIPQLWEQYKSGGGLGAAMAVGGALGALALGQAGPQVMLPEEIVTAPTAAAIMGYKGWQIGSMRKAFEIEAGAAYSEFREIPNVDDTTARVMAGIVGAVNGAIELATMSTLIKTFPGGKEALKKLAGKEVIREALRNPTTRGALIEFAKTYAKGISVETVQEVVQEFVNIVGGDILKDRAGVDVSTWKETGRRVGETAVQTIMATSLINLPGPAAGLRKNLRRANDASLTARTLSEVAQVMDTTEVKALAPSVAERYVRKNLENSGNEISYVPASKVVELYQDSSLEELREAFPDILGVTEEESIEAMEKGIDIEIDSAKLLTADKSVRDAILPFASFEPEGISQTEAERFVAWTDKNMEKDVETANYLIEQEDRYLASAQRYADSLRMRFEAMGENEKEAAANAEMAARMQITIARRLNEVAGKDFGKKTGDIMPEDVAKMFPIYFKKEDGDNLTGMYMQSAWHGSPYKFDKFSLDHVGSGEGAQAFGWGLYFAGNKEVARHYRERLTRLNGENIDNVKYKGRTAADWYGYWESRAERGGKDSQKYYDRMSMLEDYDIGKDPVDIIAEAKELGLSHEAVVWFDKTIAQSKDRPGALYKVDIPDDGKYLLWDDKISEEQSQMLIEALSESDAIDGPVANWIRKERMNDSNVTDYISEEDIADEYYPSDVLREHVETYTDFYEATGEYVYNQLKEIFGSPKDASLWLKEHGIPGIKYLDGNSRSDGKGSYNYVVFDDVNVKVLETYHQDSTKAWEQRLAKENERWNEVLAQFVPGPQSSESFRIMQVPLVLQMLGFMEEGELRIASGKFNKLLKEHENELDINDLRNLPELIANPVMVLNSSLHSTHPNSVIVVVNVQSSKNGASVFLPISLTKKSSRHLGTYYQVSSIYTQSKNGANGERIANPQRYRQWIEDEELLVYADLEQLPEWEKKNVRFSQYIKNSPSGSKEPSNVTRVQFPGRGRTRANTYIIKTELDLVNERGKYNNKLYQQFNGSIMFPRNPGQPVRITLGKTANRSTTMHEMGHWYLYMLRVLRDMDDGKNRGVWKYEPPSWVTDLNTISSWWEESAEDITGWILKKKDFGDDIKKAATPEAFRSWLDSGTAVSPEVGSAFDTAAHEYFARGFEAYLREGKAPIASLQSVFRRFKAWLTEIYRTIRQLDVELSDGVRAVFDRMLATDDAIEQFRAEREIEGAFGGELTEEEALNLSPFSDDEVYEVARERVLSGLMDELSPEMRDKVVARVDELRPQIAGAVAEERPYRILALLDAEPDMRIDEGAFIDAVSETAADSLPDGLLAADGGIDFGLAMKNLGYGSVDEFLADFSGRREFKAEVDFRLGERLKMEFASAMESPSRMEEAVRRAWYEGEEHAERLAAEAALNFADIYAADEAAKAAAEDPANRANVVRFVRTHGYVNYSSVATEFGIERARELRKREPFIFRKNGYGLDELAQEMRGNGIPISSDEHLFNIILGADTPVSPLVTARNEGYVEGRASIMYGYGKSEEQAHNRRRSLDRALKDSIGKDAAKQKLSSANTAAENIVGDMTIEGLRNVVPFVRAEKNARMKAEGALRKNDEASFRKWKERELLNNAVVRKMYKSQREAEIIRSWLDRYDKRKKNQSFGMDVRFVKQVDALLTRFSLEKMRGLTAEKRKETPQVESLQKFVEEMAAEETPILVPDWILGSTVRRNYSQLMLWQLKDVQNVVKNIVHAGRQEKRTISLNKSMEFKDIENEIIDEGKVFYGKKATGKGTELRVENKTADRRFPLPGDIADDLYTPEAICRAVGGYKDNSAMERYVFRPVREAQTRVCLALDDYFGRLQKLKTECYGDKKFSRDKFEIDVPVYERIEDPGAPGRFIYVPTKEKQRFTRENVVCFLFNLGNADNIARLKNHGFTERDINYIKDLGTENDWKFVQGVWDVLEDMRPRIAKVHELMTGTPFVPVKAQPVVTKFGTFRGGYYHIATDARYSQSAAAQLERREVMTSAGAHHLNVYTESGHRKERAADVDGRPINFSLSVLDHHVANVVYDYEMTPVIRDVRKLLKRERIQRLIEDTLGRRQALNLNKWLNDVAANTKNNGLALDTKDRMLNIAMQGTAMFSLGANTAGALLQTLGYFPLAHRIGFTNAALAAWRGVLHSHETWSLALEKSEFMREQMRNTGVELRNLRKSWTTDGKKMNAAADKMLSIYPFFQNMCNVPGWCQSYILGLKKFGGNETEAIAYADAVIRQTQSASTIADLSTFERGGAVAKLFSMFYSWFRVQYQMQTEAVRRAYYGKGFKGKMGDLASYAFYVLVCQSVVEGLIRGNAPDSDDEDPFLVRWAKWTMSRAFAASISPIPGVRDVLSFVDNDFGYRISPATSYFESFYKLGMSGNKFLSDPDGEWTDLVEPAVTAAGYATGIPNRKMIQAAKVFWSWYDEGESIPWAYLLLGGGYKPKD